MENENIESKIYRATMKVIVKSLQRVEDNPALLKKLEKKRFYKNKLKEKKKKEPLKKEDLSKMTRKERKAYYINRSKRSN